MLWLLKVPWTAKDLMSNICQNSPGLQNCVLIKPSSRRPFSHLQTLIDFSNNLTIEAWSTFFRGEIFLFIIKITLRLIVFWAKGRGCDKREKTEEAMSHCSFLTLRGLQLSGSLYLITRATTGGKILDFYFFAKSFSLQVRYLDCSLLHQQWSIGHSWVNKKHLVTLSPMQNWILIRICFIAFFIWGPFLLSFFWHFSFGHFYPLKKDLKVLKNANRQKNAL